MELVGRAGAAPVGEALQVELDIGEHTGVEQLAQLLRPEQLAQQVTVERQRRRSALGERRIALVHVRRDPVEQEARRHRTRRRSIDVHEPDSARRDLCQHLPQGGHVEHVLEALARGLQQDRERRVLRRHRQQVSRPLALLPQRCALIGAPAREQQRTAGALPEPGGEQRRLRQARHDQLVDLVGVDHERSRGRARRRPLADAPRCRRRPTSSRPAGRGGRMRRRSIAIAQGAWTGVPNGLSRHTRQSPISSRKRSTTIVRSSGTTPVAAACSARYWTTLSAANAIERVVLPEPVERLALRQRSDLAHEGAQRPAQLERAAWAVAVPERHLARLAGRGCDGDPLERDVLDAPCARRRG